MLPIIVVLGILAAFASVANTRLDLVIEILFGLVGLRVCVRSMYRYSHAVDANGAVLYPILRGILQRCRLSGMLFAIAFDLVSGMGIALVNLRLDSLLGACADEVAVVFRDVKHLMAMFGFR